MYNKINRILVNYIVLLECLIINIYVTDSNFIPKITFLLLDNGSKYDSEVDWQFSEGAIAEAVNIVFRPVQTPEILNTCGVFA